MWVAKSWSDGVFFKALLRERFGWAERPKVRNHLSELYLLRTLRPFMEPGNLCKSFWDNIKLFPVLKTRFCVCDTRKRYDIWAVAFGDWHVPGRLTLICLTGWKCVCWVLFTVWQGQRCSSGFQRNSCTCRLHLSISCHCRLVLHATMWC